MTLLELRTARLRYMHTFGVIPPRVILHPIDAMEVLNDCKHGEATISDYTRVCGLILSESADVPQGIARFTADVNSQMLTYATTL